MVAQETGEHVRLKGSQGMHQDSLCDLVAVQHVPFTQPELDLVYSAKPSQACDQKPFIDGRQLGILVSAVGNNSSDQASHGG